MKRHRPAPISKPRALTSGAKVVYPGGAEQRYGISPETRLRWERKGKLPKRDFFVGGKPVGWRPQTLDLADAGKLPSHGALAAP